MKRNFKLLVAVVVLAAMVLTLASCDVVNGLIDKINPKPHQHTFSEEWSFDETNHWHAANCNDSEECASQKSDVAAHTYVDGKCVCGAEEPACEHQYTISESKDATCTEAGSKTFACSVCGHSYTQEIAANGHTEEKLAAKAPTCTEPGLTEGKKCSVCGDVLTAQAEINATGHNYHDGKCLNCGEDDPDYIPPVTYVLDAGKLADKAKVDEEGFSHTETVGADGFFTIYYALKTKVEGNEKTFDDGVTIAKRLNWQTSTVVSADMINAAIEFTVENAATVKVWWVSGGDGRAIAIYNADGTIVAQSAEGSIKNDKYITELAIPEAGTYYLGNVGGSNNYYQVSVSFFPAPKTYIDATTTDNNCWVDKVTFTAEGEGNYTFKLPAGLGAWEVNDCDTFPPVNGPYVDYYNNAEGADFTVGLEAGATLEFYIASTEKKDWKIEWTYEASDVESSDPIAPPVVDNADLVIGSNSIVIGEAQVDDGVDFDFVVTEEGNYTFASNDLLAIISDSTGMMVGRGQAYLVAGTYTVKVVSFAGAGTYTMDISVAGAASGEPDGSEENPFVWETLPESVTFTSDTINMVYYLFTGTTEGYITITWPTADSWGSWFEMADGNTTDNNGSSSEATTMVVPVEEGKTYRIGLGTWFTAGEVTLTIAFEEGTVDTGSDNNDPSSDPNAAFVGAYEFGDYYMSIYYDDFEGCYLANVYGEGFDLYFTFIADDNFDGSYTLFLEHYETDFETGKDEYLETILNYNFVITVESEEENDDPNEAFVGAYEFGDYYMSIYYDDFEGCYLANVYGTGFDLYFTFVAIDNYDGSYTLELGYFENADYETGKDEYLETILDYNFVITPATEEEEESDPKDALAGFYEFDEYTVFIFYSESEGVHLAEIYCDNYDLYFTFEAVDIGEGMYSLMLEYYARPDWEVGTEEYLNTVLDYSIVITPVVEDEEEEEPEEDVDMVDTILVGTYTFNPEEGSVFTVKFENGYIYVLEDTIGLELSESFAYTYSPMTGMVMTDEGYFYVDVTTGDLYYGRGWLLTPVVE